MLSDVNIDLINAYRWVQHDPGSLLDRLRELSVNKETYLRLRAARPTYPVEKAVRFLYLHRTAFEGMYRLNRQGVFNVPYGGGQRTPEPLWRDNLLRKASDALANATV